MKKFLFILCVFFTIITSCITETKPICKKSVYTYPYDYYYNYYYIYEYYYYKLNSKYPSLLMSQSKFKVSAALNNSFDTVNKIKNFKIENK